MATSKTGFFGRIFGSDDSEDHGPPPEPVHLLEITDATFMTETATGHTIVDFWAPWCGPCKSFHPIYQRLADEHGEGPVRFARLNVDEAPQSAHLVGIQSIPTLVLFDPSGNEVERLVGVPRKHDVERLVKSATLS